MRYELSDFEWAAIKPFLPNKSRGVRRVNDRRVLIRRTMARSIGLLWPTHHLLQPFRPVAKGRSLVPMFVGFLLDKLRQQLDHLTERLDMRTAAATAVFA